MDEHADSALDVTALRTELAGVVAKLDVVERTGSTNADLLAAARSGAADRTVLVAELQEAGRGRLDRRWTSPSHAGLTFSVLLRPIGVPPSRWGWLPLLAGVSLVHTIRSLTTVDAALKWPNDLLLGPPHDRRKAAGLLAEVANGGDDPSVVLGIGLNVRTRADQLPDTATSLAAQGADVPRAELLTALLRRLLADEAAWREAGGDPDASGLRAAYRAACATLGARVRIELPGAERTLLAVAEDVDEDGRLVVREPNGVTRAVASGDVVHLRAV
ncbi:biotin--[acetyl-CoA-carboxylase] ligase [Pseudonocardia acaciae]|uniref:biotin--[acetyl-CoA-carboxylase] ligase n=1 Tax=Pseudonocardia acaciae TaxID=551276 RepID=UPI00048CE82A|nr:biotin--[acetyl-CoA-carboxylase] ligase [Pseudonocardia acaciae]